MRDCLIAAAVVLALAPPAAAQDGAPDGSVAQVGGFPAVLSGLAHEMAAVADHLRTGGQRRRATEALDRALHLAEFGAHADQAGRETAAALPDRARGRRGGPPRAAERPAGGRGRRSRPGG